MALHAQLFEFNLPEGENLPEATFGESQYADLLNAADSLDLLAIGIRPDSIRQLLEYRRSYGPLLSPYELQQLPAWDEELTAYCLQQLSLRDGPGRENKIQIHKPFGLAPSRDGKYLSAGTRELRSSVKFKPALAPAARPLQLRLRFRLHDPKNMSFGMALEKDAGEPWRYPSRPLPDYSSLHFFLRPGRGAFTAIAAGDYELRLGQGLLIRQGFGLFKSTASESMLAGGVRLKPHTGMDETRYLRGLALEWQLPAHVPLSLLLFASHKRVDAHMDSLHQQVFSLPETGAHPESSADWRKALPETLLGGSLRYQALSGLQLSLNAIQLSYPIPLQTQAGEAPYRLYQFSGRRNIRFSLDHKLQVQQALFFGELAISDRGFPALVQGLLLPFGKPLDLGILYRYYHPGYVDRYADAFSEASSPHNEHGLYLSIRYRHTPHWTFEAYADLWKKPWLSYNYPSPRRGYDTRLRIQWKRRKLAQAYIQFRFESREQFTAGIPPILFQQSRGWRFHFIYRLTPSLEWRMRLEQRRLQSTTPENSLSLPADGHSYQAGLSKGDSLSLPADGHSHQAGLSKGDALSLSKGDALSLSKGVLFYQELVFARLGSPLRWNIRWTHYRTDNYDARIYAYERGLLDQHGISAFYGSGQRLRLNLRYKIAKNWSAELGVRWDFRGKEVLAEGVEIMAQVLGRL